MVLGELVNLETICGRLLLVSSTQLPELFDRAPVDVCELAHAAERRWCTAARRDLRVSAPGSVMVDGDRAFLESAIDELVSNAVKYGAEGGEITLSCRCEGGHAVIEVSADGPGIEPARLSHIFERNYRGRSTQGAGSGLGLAIVAAVADAHGGGVSAVSTPGHGSTFTLRLPLVAAGNATDAATRALSS